MSAMAYIEPELLSIEPDLLDTYKQSLDQLNLYNHYFNDLLRQKAHILPKEQEMLLAGLSDFAGSPSKIFSMFNDADMTFPDVIDDQGNKSMLTKGNFSKYLESPPKPEVRRTAFQTLYATYKKK